MSEAINMISSSASSGGGGVRSASTSVQREQTQQQHPTDPPENSAQDQNIPKASDTHENANAMDTRELTKSRTRAEDTEVDEQIRHCTQSGVQENNVKGGQEIIGDIYKRSARSMNAPKATTEESEQNTEEVKRWQKESFLQLLRTVQHVGQFKENSGKGIEQEYDVDFDTTLGRGAYSKVYRAFHRNSGEKVAVKVPQRLDIGYHHASSTGLGSVVTSQLRELRLMQRMRKELDCTHLLKLHDVFDNYKDVEQGNAEHYRMFIVTKYLSGGDLLHRLVRLHKKGIKYSEYKAACCFYEICKGISELHKANIIHRDLKPDNLLLDKDEDEGEATIVIGDFGFSVTTDHEPRNRFVGTPSYAAPEVWAQPPLYSKAADVWSAGVVLFLLLSGNLPFWVPHDHHKPRHEVRMHLKQQIASGSYSMSGTHWNNVSDAAKDLVRRMLTVDFRQRITIEEVMNHPWMTQSGVTSDVDLTDAVNSLSEFNARRKLRASAWAVAWSRRITALRAAKLRPYVQSFSLSPELLRSLKFLFSSASRGRNPSEVFEEVKQHGIPKSWEDEARHHAPQQYRTISKKQFMKIMELLGFDNVPLERMYEVFDADSDGHLDYTEFLFGLTLLNKSGEDAIKACFDIFDKDGTGDLCRDEICALLNASAAARGFQGTENNGGEESDDVDSDELEQQADEIEEVFETLDVNADDKISYEEFKNGLKKKPELRKLLLEPILTPARSVESKLSRTMATENTGETTICASKVSSSVRDSSTTTVPDNVDSPKRRRLEKKL